MLDIVAAYADKWQYQLNADSYGARLVSQNEAECPLGEEVVYWAGCD